uniref:Uncharacterized protein n=1 Tax=Anopheles farauti TaxID=69004 RepID=A0A182PZT0_9DIPT
MEKTHFFTVHFEQCKISKEGPHSRHFAWVNSDDDDEDYERRKSHVHPMLGCNICMLLFTEPQKKKSPGVGKSDRLSMAIPSIVSFTLRKPEVEHFSGSRVLLLLLLLVFCSISYVLHYTRTPFFIGVGIGDHLSRRTRWPKRLVHTGRT